MQYDGGPDDSFVEGEEEQEIDWEAVEELQEQFNEINAIEDDEKRLLAAIKLVNDMEVS